MFKRRRLDPEKNTYSAAKCIPFGLGKAIQSRPCEAIDSHEKKLSTARQPAIPEPFFGEEIRKSSRM